jgi:selenocysteine lyase/cysteine desulfurase
LVSGYIFADNAGGSQAAKPVIDKIVDYLVNTNVQLSADYSISAKSTQRVLSEGPAAAAKFVNAKSPDEIVFSASSTMNLENLARGLENNIQPGDEFIVTGEHEGMSWSSK